MGFDSFIDEFDKADENRVSTTPAIVTETIEVGTKIIDTDYMSKIQGIEEISKYLESFKHMNLYDLGWRFQFGSSKQWAGQCVSSIKDDDENAKSRDRNIFVSIQYTKHDKNWKQNMEGVILHEAAHAIVAEIFYFTANGRAELDRIDDQHRAAKGHGKIWKLVCHAISGTEHDCAIYYKNSNLKESIKNFKYDCPNCEYTGYGNSIFFTKRCEKCDKSVIVEPNVL